MAAIDFQWRKGFIDGFHADRSARQRRENANRQYDDAQSEAVFLDPRESLMHIRYPEKQQKYGSDGDGVIFAQYAQQRKKSSRTDGVSICGIC